MKTVGELISKARKSKKLTIGKLSRITKIDPEHIKNLEKNRYYKLPPPTFIKGFIRNIATILNQNPDLLAHFKMITFAMIADFAYYKNIMKKGFTRKLYRETQ